MHIYRVLATSIHFVLLCTDTLSVHTQTKKCHFTRYNILKEKNKEIVAQNKRLNILVIKHPYMVELLAVQAEMDKVTTENQRNKERIVYLEEEVKQLQK